MPELLIQNGNYFAVLLGKVSATVHEVGQFSTPAPAVAAGAVKVPQKTLSMAATKKAVHAWQVDPSMEGRYKALARGCRGPVASAWFLPPPHVSPALTDGQFRSAVGLRLFLEEFPPSAACPFVGSNHVPEIAAASNAFIPTSGTR